MFSPINNWAIKPHGHYHRMDPNMKLKNFQPPPVSSVSGNEIALRFAFLDLLQKLRRTEMFCEYYERCRNELVQGYLRLRQERDYYLHLLRSQSELSRSDSPPFRDYNADSFTPVKHPNSANFVFNKDGAYNAEQHTEESYEEIEQRLIQQFKEVMQQMKREGTASNKAEDNAEEDIDGSPGTSGDVDDMTPPPEACMQNDQETLAVQNVLRDQINRENQSDSDSKEINKSKEKQDAIKCAKCSAIIKSSCDVNSEDALGRLDLRKELGITDSESASPQFQKLLSTVISDYEKISRILLAQNEKLRKANSRKMRNYFKRQLDPDEKRSGPTNPFT